MSGNPLAESSDSFAASAIVSTATGWSEPPGRELHPLKSSAFHGAQCRLVATFTVSASSARQTLSFRLYFAVQMHHYALRKA